MNPLKVDYSDYPSAREVASVEIAIEIARMRYRRKQRIRNFIKGIKRRAFNLFN